MSAKTPRTVRAPSGLLNPVPLGQHRLPPLPYAYDALEPNISRRIMRIHHDEHHQSYVDGLNRAELALAQARRMGNFRYIKYWERELAFHGAGHYLHTLFWQSMSPHGGGLPTGAIAGQINRWFGGFANFKRQFSRAAEEVEASGWAMLVWAPRAQRIEILQVEKHQNLSQQDIIPLLVLDVWEHAYYLQYQANRKLYIENWWNVVNWHTANRRLLRAMRVRWQPY